MAGPGDETGGFTGEEKERGLEEDLGRSERSWGEEEERGEEGRELAGSGAGGCSAALGLRRGARRSRKAGGQSPFSWEALDRDRRAGARRRAAGLEGRRGTDGTGMA